MSRINVDVVLVDSLIEHVSFTRSQVQVTVHSSVPILGARVGVSLGHPKTIEHLSRHAYLNFKVIKSQTVIGAD